MSFSDSEMLESLDVGNDSIQLDQDVPHFQDDLMMDDVFGTGPGGLPAAGLQAAVGLPAAAGLTAAAGLPANVGLQAAVGLPAAAGLTAAVRLPAGVGPGPSDQPEVLVVHQKRKPYRSKGKLKKPKFSEETKDKLEAPVSLFNNEEH